MFKVVLLNILVIIMFNGCLATLALVGTAVSSGMTVQEIDEEYNGSVEDYVSDKSESFYNYIKKSVD